MPPIQYFKFKPIKINKPFRRCDVMLGEEIPDPPPPPRATWEKATPSKRNRENFATFIDVHLSNTQLAK